MTKTAQRRQLKQLLEALYEKYNHFENISSDPLQFVYRFKDPGDREIAAFLSAGLAYGRVEQIAKSLENLFTITGTDLYKFVINFDRDKRNKLKSFKHRFNTGDDISDLLELFQDVYKRFGTLENYFLKGYDYADENILNALESFCTSLLETYRHKHGNRSKGLEYLLVRPSSGSACKRLNLFLRWMVRDDCVDTGLWNSVDKAKLVIPMDVHMTRLCRFLKLYDKKTVSIKTAVDITNKFRQLEPGDPVKYDFALTRIGIVNDCTGKFSAVCTGCELFGSYCEF